MAYDDGRISDKYRIVMYPSDTHTFLCLPKLVAAYLFGDSESPDEINGWVENCLEDEAKEFREFVNSRLNDSTTTNSYNPEQS